MFEAAASRPLGLKSGFCFSITGPTESSPPCSCWNALFCGGRGARDRFCGGGAAAEVDLDLDRRRSLFTCLLSSVRLGDVERELCRRFDICLS